MSEGHFLAFAHSAYMPEKLPKSETLPSPVLNPLEEAFAKAKPLEKPAPKPMYSPPPTIKAGPVKDAAKPESSSGQAPPDETKEPVKQEEPHNALPQHPGHPGKSYNKRFLAVCGVTIMEHGRVLLPRQVTPFCKPWEFIASTVRFMRWQIAMHLEDTHNENGVRPTLQPVWEHHSLLADRLSYKVTSRPDGCAGFTGRKMVVEGPMYRAEVKGLVSAIDTADWHSDLRESGESMNKMPAELMAGIIPKFYITLPQEEVTRLETEASNGSENLLRKVFDISKNEWLLLWELRPPYEARPVVISDRPAIDPLIARWLHDEYGSGLLNAKVYIGGNGLSFKGISLDPDVTEASAAANAQIQTLHLKMDALLRRQDPKLTSFMVPLPSRSHDTSRKGLKDPRNKVPVEKHDNLREYLDGIINGAERVVERRMSGKSANL